MLFINCNDLYVLKAWRVLCSHVVIASSIFCAFTLDVKSVLNENPGGILGVTVLELCKPTYPITEMFIDSDTVCQFLFVKIWMQNFIVNLFSISE
jgi:hypothetical protein